MVLQQAALLKKRLPQQRVPLRRRSHRKNKSKRPSNGRNRPRRSHRLYRLKLPLQQLRELKWTRRTSAADRRRQRQQQELLRQKNLPLSRNARTQPPQLQSLRRLHRLAKPPSLQKLRRLFQRRTTARKPLLKSCVAPSRVLWSARLLRSMELTLPVSKVPA